VWKVTVKVERCQDMDAGAHQWRLPLEEEESDQKMGDSLHLPGTLSDQKDAYLLSKLEKACAIQDLKSSPRESFNVRLSHPCRWETAVMYGCQAAVS
jgi:hypothetical protein